MRGSVGSRWGAKIAAFLVAQGLALTGVAGPVAAVESSVAEPSPSPSVMAPDATLAITVPREQWWRGQIIPVTIEAAREGESLSGSIKITAGELTLLTSGVGKVTRTLRTENLPAGDYELEVTFRTWDKASSSWVVLSESTPIRVDEPTTPVVTPTSWYVTELESLRFDISGTAEPQSGTVMLFGRSAVIDNGVALIPLAGLPISRSTTSIIVNHLDDTGALVATWSQSVDLLRRPTDLTAEVQPVWRTWDVVEIPVRVTSDHGVPSGSVDVSIGGEYLKTETLVDGRAVVRIDPSTLRGDSTGLKLSYRGSLRFESRSQWYVVAITRPAPTTVQVRTGHRWTYGKPRTVRVTVSASGAIPTGQVELWNAGRKLGSGQLVDGKVAIRFGGKKLEPGRRTITAKYIAPPHFSPSRYTWSQRVQKAQPIVKLVLPRTSFPIGGDLGATQPATIKVNTVGMPERGKLVLWTRDTSSSTNTDWRNWPSVASWRVQPRHDGVRHVRIPSRLLSPSSRYAPTYLKVRYIPDDDAHVAKKYSNSVTIRGH